MGCKNIVTLKPKKPGGAIIEVWYNKGPYWPHWSFAITHNSVRRRFGGSNRCDTRHSAICKARIRAKYLDDGTWDKHYTIDHPGCKSIKAYNNAMERIKEYNIIDGFTWLGF